MSDEPGTPCAIELVGDPDRPGGWTLLSGGFPQSHVDLADPRYLEFEYVRRLGHLVDLAAPAERPLRVLHLGGGALTLARYVAATRPGSPQLAVDSDASLVATVRERLPLAQPGRKNPGSRPDQGPRRGRQDSCLKRCRPAPSIWWWPTSSTAAAPRPT